MSNCPVALIPIVTKRCSPTASLSSRVKACSSLSTVAASAKETACSRQLASALNGFQLIFDNVIVWTNVFGINQWIEDSIDSCGRWSDPLGGTRIGGPETMVGRQPCKALFARTRRAAISCAANPSGRTGADFRRVGLRIKPARASEIFAGAAGKLPFRASSDAARLVWRIARNRIMKIGIIGAGFIGRGLASLAGKSDHEVMISNSRAPRTLGSTAVALRCQVGTAADAAAFGEVVMLAIPFYAIDSLPADALMGKIVVDANNYYPERDGAIAELDRNETTTSEMLARHLTGARVVKAFNAILQRDLEVDCRAAGAPDRRALPIAGDDAQAKQVVTGLLDQFGYDTVDAGPLAEGWRFQRAKPAYCIRLDSEGMKRALAAARRDVEVPHGSWRA